MTRHAKLTREITVVLQFFDTTDEAQNWLAFDSGTDEQEEMEALAPEQFAEWQRWRDGEMRDFTACRNPGRSGCQECDACSDLGDTEYHAMKEDGRL